MYRHRHVGVTGSRLFRWDVAAIVFLTMGISGCFSSNALTAHTYMTLGDPATSGLKTWTGPSDSEPKAYDFNGDGVDELVVHSNDTKVYVFSLKGKVLAVLPTKYPPAWHIERILNAPEAGVLVPGEPPSILIANHAAYVAAWRFVPATSDKDHFEFTKTWEIRTTSCYASPGMDAKPVLADLNKDGQLEVLIQTEERGFYALNANGTTMWKNCWGGGNSAPVVADLDSNGMVEVVVASDAGFISVLAGINGAPMWTFDAKAYGITPASIPTAPTIADLDGKRPLEVLFVAREAKSNNAATFKDNHMAIFAVRQNLQTYQSELVWMRQPVWANPLSYTQLVVRDVDDDGRVDIFGMDWNTIGHSPGNWELLGPAHVFRLNDQGEDVWVREINAWWSNQDIAVADVNGDGSTDVLANGPGEGGDGLWRLNAKTGAAEEFIPAAPWDLLRGPVLADLRHNGNAHLLFPVQAADKALPRGAILVFDLGVPMPA